MIMWNKTTQLRHGVNTFFLRLLLKAGVWGVVFLSKTSWADPWPAEPPLDAAYVDWESLSVGVSGKAPPHFLVPSAAQSRLSSEHLARLNAAERLFLLIQELRLSRTLTLGECAPPSALKEALEKLLLSRAPTAHWRFSDGGQSFFFKLPISSLAPLCPEFSKAIAQLPSLSAEEIFSRQGEAKVLWVTPSQEAKAEPCLFPVLFSEDQKWFLDTAAAGYVVVWSAKAPAAPKAPPSKTAPSKSRGTTPQDSGAWAIGATQKGPCGFELGNEVAATLNSKIHEKQLGQRMVVRMQGKAK